MLKNVLTLKARKKMTGVLSVLDIFCLCEYVSHAVGYYKRGNPFAGSIIKVVEAARVL